MEFQQWRAWCHQQPETIDFSSQELREKLLSGPPANFYGFVVFLLPLFSFFFLSFHLFCSPGRDPRYQERSWVSKEEPFQRNQRPDSFPA